MGFSNLSLKLSQKLSSCKKSKKGSFKATLSDIQEHKEAGNCGEAIIIAPAAEQVNGSPAAGPSPGDRMSPRRVDSSNDSNSNSAPDAGQRRDVKNKSQPCHAADARIVSKSPIAAPIRRTHLKCFTGHSEWSGCRNTHHSLPCMACKREGCARLWKCPFCLLRVCGECRRGLGGREHGSLQRLLESLGRA